jgi:hypothetical protein
MMKKSHFKSYRKHNLSAILLLLVMLLNVSNVFGSKPKIKFSSSAVYQRMSMVDTDEEMHWRSLLSYDQDFGKHLSIDALIEYGSENEHFQNPFRVHHLTADIKLWNHDLSIGRIAIWNALQNARIDGAKLDINTKKFGSLSLAGGVEAVTDFSDTLFADYTYVMATWSTGKVGNNLALSFWGKGDTEDFDPYTGIQLSTKKFGVRLSYALAIDIGEEKLNYQRLRISKRFGEHTVGIGFRQKRFELWEEFQELSEVIGISPTITFDINSLVSEYILWRNQLSYRLAEEGKTFLVSSINFKNLYASILGGFEGDNMEYGVVLGASHKLKMPISFGGSISFNAIDYGDFTDLESSTGAYGWIGWKPKDFIMIKLFGRFSNNEYFKQDGRVGVTLNVAF